MKKDFKAAMHYRLASAELGDDCTLTRYVRTNDHGNKKPRRLQPRLDGIGVPAYVKQGRTKFPSRVMQTSEMTNLLVSGHSNIKIGRDVRKGHLNGYWIYTLSLEERKTCPSTCRHWQTCYGSNMPFAKRVDHTDPQFLPRLEAEIAVLCKKRYGVLIRLHALGDFYSSEYVAFWDRMLRKHKNLSLFGYSAHPNKSTIGWTLHHLRMEWGKRAMIRTSDGPYPTMATVSIGSEEGKPANAFICPEQTGKVQCCATCGACWSTTKNVAFMEH